MEKALLVLLGLRLRREWSKSEAGSVRVVVVVAEEVVEVDNEAEAGDEVVTAEVGEMTVEELLLAALLLLLQLLLLLVVVEVVVLLLPLELDNGWCWW